MMSKSTQKKKKLTTESQQPSSRVRSSPSRDTSYVEPLKTMGRLFSPYWIACIPLTAIIVIVWNQAASAQGAPPGFESPGSVEELSTTLDAIFLTIAAVLVIFMNAGFGMLETGFCRQKNAVNILSKNLIVFGLATISYWIIGFALMYGANGNSWIGWAAPFLAGDPTAYGKDPYPANIPVTVYFLFQVTFAGTAATIVSGAVAERIKFVDFIIFSVLLVAISYPITGHWVWSGSGWLGNVGENGFQDFAGSTVVHSVGGWAALMGAALLGPREGKYREDGRTKAIPGHNMSLATLGCLILWIGWFGFNPGSELAATANVPYIALTTNLSAAAGAILATVTSWAKDGKPDLSMIVNGVLAGLVGITAGCASVTLWGAVVIGAIAGIIVVFAVAFFDAIKIDDPVGAISVHLICGMWGTIAVAIFAPEYRGFEQLLIQLLGIGSIGLFTVIASSIFWMALKVLGGIRVGTEEEIQGLDIGEHAMESYSGFVKETDIFSGSSVSSIGSSSSDVTRSSET